MRLLGTALTAIFLLITVHAYADTPAPQTIVIVACRVDDLTGQPGRHDPNMAAKGWRDLELHIEDGELQCKRIQIDLVDAVAVNHPFTQELNANFADWTQCARIGVVQAQAWNEENKNWATVAIGCPTKIVNEIGETVGWKLPECPSYFPGTNSPMRCRFDPSVI